MTFHTEPGTEKLKGGNRGKRMGKGNPIGKNNEAVSATVPREIHEEMLRLARENGVGPSTYAKYALIYAVKHRMLFEAKTALVIERLASQPPTASAVADKTSALIADARPKQKSP
jgi:hypothetical protein